MAENPCVGVELAAKLEGQQVAPLLVVDKENLVADLERPGHLASLLRPFATEVPEVSAEDTGR